MRFESKIIPFYIIETDPCHVSIVSCITGNYDYLPRLLISTRKNFEKDSENTL